MNIIEAKMNYPFRLKPYFRELETTIENSHIALSIKNQNLHINIIGSASPEKLEKLLFELLSLVFLYIGGYPKIDQLLVNHVEKDIANLLAKFTTSNAFIRKSSILCNIDKTTINEKVLINYREIPHIPIISIEYLVSDEYKSVVANHKIILLLHSLEGLADKSRYSKLKDELKTILGKKSTVEKYKPHVYGILKDYFFDYHTKFDFEILPLLEVNEMEFLDKITKTRDWYSHYLNYDHKPERLKYGSDMIIYFYILFFCIRAFIIDQIQVGFDETKLIEHFYTIHDWILDAKYKKDSPLKSKAYNINKRIKQMVEMFGKAHNKSSNDT